MSTFRFTWDIVDGEFAEKFADLKKPIAQAAMEAMVEVRDTVKAQGRAAIAAAGFSKKWQNALRADYYPGGPKAHPRPSTHPAVFVHHNIQYADVFEEGATIHGNPMVWVPLQGTPVSAGGKRLTPARMEQNGIKLVSFMSSDGLPLLGTPIRTSAKNASISASKLSYQTLRRGLGGTGKATKLQPLFFGISSVKLRKRFSIREICAKVAATIPSLYAAKLVVEEK